MIIYGHTPQTKAWLTCLFYELALHPECIPILQEEVDGVFDGPEAPDATTLRKLEYLNAVINETLRLHPPVPSGVQRMTSPEGMTIGDTFIPGNTIVQAPAHALTRDGRYFDRPEEFVPERWTSKPELVKDERAFVPFSTGRYSCIGKQLGPMEIRHVSSQILRRYNVALAPGQTPAAFLQGKQDTFTLQLAPLNMVFPLRKGNGSVFQEFQEFQKEVALR
ncbi:cytochrome P450 [Ilyonectria destructans]|nr:cytochrome P450 [Ilyonectria destructans]